MIVTFTLCCEVLCPLGMGWAKIFYKIWGSCALFVCWFRIVRKPKIKLSRLNDRCVKSAKGGVNHRENSNMESGVPTSGCIFLV